MIGISLYACLIAAFFKLTTSSRDIQIDGHRLLGAFTYGFILFDVALTRLGVGATLAFLAATFFLLRANSKLGEESAPKTIAAALLVFALAIGLHVSGPGARDVAAENVARVKRGCRENLKTLSGGAEMYQLDKGTPTEPDADAEAERARVEKDLLEFGIDILRKGGYIHAIPRCPGEPAESTAPHYEIVKRGAGFEGRCKVHGTIRELDEPPAAP